MTEPTREAGATGEPATARRLPPVPEPAPAPGLASPGDVQGDALALHQVELELQNQELRAAEARLEAARTRSAELFDGAPVAACLLSRRGNVLELNRAAAALLEAPPLRAAGRPLVALVRFDDGTDFLDLLGRALAGGGAPARADLTFRTRGGREVAARFVGAAARDEEGGLTCRLTMVEVDDRLRLERGLRAVAEAGATLAGARDEAQIVAAAARAAVPALACAAVVDLIVRGGALSPRAAVVHVDGARAEDLREAEARWGPLPSVGLAAVDALQQRRGQLVPTPASYAALAAKDEEHGRFLARLGLHAWLAVPLLPDVDAAPLGVLRLAVGPGRPPFEADDVEVAAALGRLAGAALAAARRLAAADEAVQTRDSLLAEVAHDLGTPATVVQLVAATLERTAPHPATPASLTALGRAADRLRALTLQLQDLTSLDLGRLRLVRALHAPADVVHDAVALHAPLAALEHVTLRADVEPGPPVLLDRDRVGQVLSNLLENAIRAAPAGSEVVVGARRTPRGARFHVEDAGPGLTPDELARVFDRAARPARAVAGVAGLGLAIARGIVHAHGGRIWAECAPGRPTVFAFELPRSSEEGA
ncbi:MAG: HAMP domain-containing histidine kinase [Planctomycetes bacterium]|nr:HAMP domain-containing histidine kinase [Planctomycetota bacterium]